MRSLVKIIVMLSAVYMACAKNSCTTKDSSGVANPIEIMGPYLKTPSLLKTYLSKFKHEPSLDAFLKIAEKGTTDENTLANILGWEIGMVITQMGKTKTGKCEIPALIRQSVAYELSGKTEDLLCVINFLDENAKRAASDIVEIAMDNFGCPGIYKKPIRTFPKCYYDNCDASDATAWKELFPVIEGTFKKYGIPIFPETYGVLDSMYKSNDFTQQRVAGIWFSLAYHVALLQEFELGADPVVYNLIAKLVSFMEVIAYSKDCSCAERNQALVNAEKAFSKAIDLEVALWKKTIV